MPLPTRRGYKGAAASTVLSSGVDDSAATVNLSVDAIVGWPTPPYFVVIDPGSVREEKVRVTSVASTTLTVVRGVDDTSRSLHDKGAVVYPVFTATEADEANQIASVMTTKGDLISTNGTTINRLAVGATDTHVLQVDTVSTNGIKWGQVATAGIADGAINSAKILDGTIVLADLAASLQAFLLPTGTINIWPTAIAPTGWLLCNGQSTTGYGNLAALVGATVPDMQGRFPLGDDGSLTLGAVGGSTTIITANLPVHQHSVTSSVSVSSTFTGTAVANHSHAKGTLVSDSNSHNHATTSTDDGGSHFHGLNATTNAFNTAHGHGTASSVSAASGTDVSGSTVAYTNSDGTHNHTFDIPTGGSHSHTISGSTADGGAHTPGGTIANTVTNGTVTSGIAGSGTAYYQPHIVINYIIKT